MNQNYSDRPAFRVWITKYEGWQPQSWNSVPPRSQAIEPADDSVLSAAEAAGFVQAFNQAMLASESCKWAVAVPVQVRCDGDLCSGQNASERAIDLLSGRAQA